MGRDNFDQEGGFGKLLCPSSGYYLEFMSQKFLLMSNIRLLKSFSYINVGSP